jgi:hypothetical protein
MCSKANDSLKFWVWCVLDTHSALGLIEKHTDDLGLDKNVQVRVFAVLELWVEVSMCRVLTLAVGTDIAQPTLYAVVRIQSLQVFDLFDATGFGGLDEVVFGSLGSVSAVGHVDRAIVAVVLFLSGSVVCFELRIC